MRVLRIVFPLGLIMALALAVACGSGGDESARVPDPVAPHGGDPSAPVVANVTEVLGASAERFEQEVSSLRAELEFSVTGGDMSMDATADMSFQAPDQMYMTMEFGGEFDSGDGSGGTINLSDFGDIEILLLGTDIYMKVPFTGWVSMSLSDLGVEADIFEEALSQHSLMDYQAIVDEMGAEVEDLGIESIEGANYRHYRATMDFEQVMAAFSDAVGSGEGFPFTDVSGPITMDFWLEESTLLPYRVDAAGELSMGGEAMAFDMRMAFLDYNEPVEIPEAPADAVPFDELDLSGVSAGS